MKSMSRPRKLALPALLALLWLLTGCTISPTSPTSGSTGTPTQGTPSPVPAESDLPFETIERGESNYYQFHPTEPQHIFLITSAEEATRLTDWVSTTAQQALAQLDYQRYFVIALFRGHFGSSGYDAIIQRVTRQDEGLVVHAQFWAPSPYYAVTTANSKPYHLVRVLRDGGPLWEVNLALKSQAVTPTPPPEIRRLTSTPRR